MNLNKLKYSINIYVYLKYDVPTPDLQDQTYLRSTIIFYIIL